MKIKPSSPAFLFLTFNFNNCLFPGAGSRFLLFRSLQKIRLLIKSVTMVIYIVPVMTHVPLLVASKGTTTGFHQDWNYCTFNFYNNPLNLRIVSQLYNKIQTLGSYCCSIY
jgi:hypothetical protein